MEKFIHERFTVLVIFIILLIPSRVLSSDVYMKIGPELRYLNGHTTYHTSFDDVWANGGHGESILEFPVNALMAGINFEAGKSYNKNIVSSRWNLTYLAVFSGTTETMTDSDIIENDDAFGELPHSGVDLYTESDSLLKQGTFLELNYLYNLYKEETFSIGPILGYRYYRLQYDVIGCNGVYWTTPVVCLDEKQIFYRVAHGIPYVGLSTDLVFTQDAVLNIMLLYSNWVKTRDRDVHLYPDWDAANAPDDLNNVSECDCEGEAHIIALKWRWTINPQWSLNLGADYTDINTFGRQTQKTYLNGSLIAVNLIPIRDGVDTALYEITAGVSYMFH